MGDKNSARFKIIFFYIGRKGENIISPTANVLARGCFNGSGKGGFDIDEEKGETAAGSCGSINIRTINEDSIE